MILLRVIFLYLLLPTLLFSGEFTASVNHNQINKGESLLLKLTLEEASAQGAPDLSGLNGSFSIDSQHHSTNTVVVNRSVTSSIVWKISLTPLKEGEVVIPSISVNTKTGPLSTEPIRIKVSPTKTMNQDSSPESGVAITTHLSKDRPYNNEPVFYTVKLSSKSELANVRIQQLSIKDAITEPNGEPKVYRKIIEGITMNVIEMSYLITPLKSGIIKIPSIIIQGAIQTKRVGQRGSFHEGAFESLFGMADFDQLKPFTIATDEPTLIVEPAIAGMNPWLPAQSIQIEEGWDDSQPLQVGEPIVRSFKIVGEGVLANQLSSLNTLQLSDHQFKIYADNPETGNETDEGVIRSFRKEQYTLVPQAPGELTLPEISVTWWDVNRKEKAITKVPARTLHILPAPATAQFHNAPVQEEKNQNPVESAHVFQIDPIIYGLISALVVLFMGAIGWGIALKRKIKRLTEKPIEKKMVVKPVQVIQEEPKVIPKDKNEKLPDLNPT